MEKQIVLRENKIKWREHDEGLSTGIWYIGTVNGEPVLIIRDEHHVMLHGAPIGKVKAPFDNVTKQAESIFTDWLRSIATITE